MSDHPERRLAAVMAVDVVGYSRLIGENETGTLEALRRFRTETFGPTVAGNRGNLVKSMGDGWLVEFASAVQSVNCALAIQDRLADDPLISLRIGVHVGDIVIDAEDIFGDAVNMASRLEHFAEPGTVAISDAVYGSLDGTLTPSFDDAGIHKLKNITRPARIWLRKPRQRQPVADAALKAAGDFPAIAIMPIHSPATRPEIGELADAITHDVTTHLNSASWMHAQVVSQRASAGYVLQGRLRAQGERLRLEAELRDGNDTPIWADRIDGRLDDGFDWQDTATERVATNALGVVFDHEKKRLEQIPETERTAPDWVLLGILERSNLSAVGMRRSLDYFSRAIAIDDGLAIAYGQAINIFRGAGNFGYTDVVAAFADDFAQWLHKSEALAADNAVLDLALAWVQYVENREPERLRFKLEHHLRLSPFDPEILHLACIRYTILGDPDAAVDCFERFRKVGRLSPFRSAAFTVGALGYLQMGKDETAIHLARQALAITRDYSAPYRVIASAHAHLGQREEAREAIRELRALTPDETVATLRNRIAYADTPGTRRYFEGLERAGLPVT